VVSKQAEQSDPAQLRAVIMSLGPAPFSVDDAQREISAVRERLNQKPFHTPIQLVQTAIAELVTAGELLELREPGQPIGYQIEPSRIAKRRALLIQAVMNDRSKMANRRILLETVVAPPADLEDLIGAGLLKLTGDGDDTLVTIPVDVSLDLVRRGSESLARTTVPDSNAVASANDIAMEAMSKLEAKLRIVETKLDRLRIYLRKNGVPDVEELINGIFEAERDHDAAEQEDFDWSVTIGPAEREWLTKQWLRATSDIADHERHLESVKLAVTAAKKQLNHEVEEIKAALQSNTWVFERKVRREPDWSTRTINFVDVVTGRVLKSEPIPRGMQKPLFADGVPALPTPSGAVDASPAAMQAVGLFVDTMKEKDFRVTAGKTKNGTPEIVASQEDGDEPGPLATPEQKQKRSRKKASATSSPA
jgi:hypothetical protein